MMLTKHVGTLSRYRLLGRGARIEAGIGEGPCPTGDGGARTPDGGRRGRDCASGGPRWQEARRRITGADGERGGRDPAGKCCEQSGKGPCGEGREAGQREEQYPYRERNEAPANAVLRRGPQELAVGPDPACDWPRPEEHSEGVSDREREEQALQPRRDSSKVRSGRFVVRSRF